MTNSTQWSTRTTLTLYSKLLNSMTRSLRVNLREPASKLCTISTKSAMKDWRQIVLLYLLMYYKIRNTKLICSKRNWYSVKTILENSKKEQVRKFKNHRPSRGNLSKRSTNKKEWRRKWYNSFRKPKRSCKDIPKQRRAATNKT